MVAAPVEFRLQASPDSKMSQECFAVFRPSSSSPPCFGNAAPVVRCTPDEVSQVSYELGSEPAFVDIFLRLGSMSLESLEVGAVKEATLKPDLAEVTLRLSVVGAGEQAMLANSAADATVGRAVKSESGKSPGAFEVQYTAPEFHARVSDFLPRPPLSPMSPASPPPKRVCYPSTGPTLPSPRLSALSSPSLPSTGLLPGAPGNAGDKLYKPVSLNNCSQILPNLYLGVVDAASDTVSLVRQGIRGVVCCCRELEFPSNEFHADIEYFRVDVEDVGREPIELFFDEAMDFIHSWIRREQPVLVHCRAGVSRSASIVLAYLIAHNGFSLHDAFFLACSKRSIVTPNIGFMEKLCEYEERKRGASQATIDLGKYITWYSTSERPAVPDLAPD